jgi:hypothetical protein
MSSRSDVPLAVQKVLRYGGRQYDREFENKDVDAPGILELLDEEIGDSGVESDDFSDYFTSLTRRDLYTEGLLLGAVLNGRYSKFEIPDYQRNYSWDKKQNRRFWHSIRDALSNVGGSDIPEFYMGSMYVADERNALEIIDGQQRLTTLLLVLLNIRRYLIALEQNTNAASRHDVWDLVEFIVGPECLKDMIYDGGRPVLSPSDIDQPYLELLFQEDPSRTVSHAEEIDIESDGRRIGLETVLNKHLGIDPEDINEHLSSSEPGTIYYSKSHERLLHANHTYREEIGKVLGVVNGCIDNNLDASIEQVDDDEVTIKCTTEGYPAMNVDLVVIDGDDIVHRTQTDEEGRETIDLSSFPDASKLIARKQGTRRVFSFSDASSLISETEQYEVLDCNSDREEIRLQIFRNGDPANNTDVSINELEKSTDDDGIIEFSIPEVDRAVDDESEAESVEDAESYTLEVLSIRASFDEVGDLQKDEPVLDHLCSDPTHRPTLLINVFLILLHSMRVVYAEFSLSDDEYKIEIFQSLNDRGKDLDVSDIIRARVIASDASNPDDWNEIVKRFSDDDDTVIQFLKNYLVAEQSIENPSEEDVKSLFSLRKVGNPKIESLLLGDPDSSLQTLNEYSERYHDIKKAQLPDDTDEIDGLHIDDDTDQSLKAECEVVFKHLNRVGNVWEPFVLSVYKSFSDETNQGESMVEILRTVERIIYRYSFFGQDIASTIISDLFPTACQKYNSGDLDKYDPEPVRKMLKRYLPNGLEGDSVINQLVRKEGWTAKKVETLYLKLLEDELLETDTRGTYTSGHFWVDPEADLTVEHIFPQTYVISAEVDAKTAWLEHFFDGVDSAKTVMQKIDGLDPDDPELSEADEDDITDLFVKDIGNMLLLIRSDNSTVKNKLFAKKACFYYLVCRDDLEHAGEYLLDHEFRIGDIVNITEELADEADLSDEELAGVLGLLIDSRGGPAISAITTELDRSIPEGDLESTEYEGEVKDSVSKLMSFENVDETSSIGSTVDEYNEKWNYEAMIQRKTHIIEQLLESVTIEGSPEEFNDDVEDLVKDDIDRRLDLRRTA